MDLPHALSERQADAHIPPPLADAVGRATAAGGPAGLYETLSELEERSRDMASLAMSVDATLEVEEGADRQLHQAYGARWRAMPSAALNEESRAELEVLRGKLSAAASADEALRGALDARAEALEALSLPFEVLDEQVPQAGAATRDAADDAADDVSSLLDSLETTSRAMDATLAEAKAACGGEAAVSRLTDDLIYRAGAAMGGGGGGDGGGGARAQVARVARVAAAAAAAAAARRRRTSSSSARCCRSRRLATG